MTRDVMIPPTLLRTARGLLCSAGLIAVDSKGNAMQLEKVGRATPLWSVRQANINHTLLQVTYDVAVKYLPTDVVKVNLTQSVIRLHSSLSLSSHTIRSDSHLHPFSPLPPSFPASAPALRSECERCGTGGYLARLVLPLSEADRSSDGGVRARAQGKEGSRRFHIMPVATLDLILTMGQSHRRSPFWAVSLWWPEMG